METTKLRATKRDLIGKRVKLLRASGQLPGVVYGAGIESVPIELEAKEASRVLSRSSGSTLIELDVDGEKHSVLVRDVQRDVIRGNYLHVDFLNVALDVKIRAAVPIELIGEASALQEAGAVLLTGLNTIEVEALPADLPDRITVDLEVIEKIDDSINVSDLYLGENVTILAEPEELVVRAMYQAEEIIEEIVVEEELEAELEGEELEEGAEQAADEDEQPAAEDGGEEDD